MAAVLALACPGALAADPQPPAVDVELFTRQGCPRCDEAAAWLAQLRSRRPAMTVAVADVGADPLARERLRAVSGRAVGGAVSVPAFLVRGVLVVGFSGAGETGARVEAILDGAGVSSPPAGSACTVEGDPACVASPAAAAAAAAEDGVLLPLVGRVRIRDLGLPLFTVVIGLVDGFNPCATWVLLFLLSFLAGLGSRARMLVIAGEFVLVSAIAYYAFMAAWVAAYALVGVSRAVQVAIAAFGLTVGVVNVKDFVSLGKGISFHIPDSAKPGIYRRMRAIVHARSLTLALIAAGVLAVLVNVVELLCTAGLPALYTQVLASRDLPAWKRYAYLAVYDAAYVLDDAILVGIGVVTLGHHKLQERGGRWLKLLSGVVMIALALVLLLRPGWLSR